MLLWLFVLGLLFFCLPGWTQEEEEGEFKGAGVHIKLKGAWVTFAGGDIDKGTSGMQDRHVAEVVAAGFELRENNKKSFRNGYEMGGEIVYYFTPRIGFGVGANLFRGHRDSTSLFHWPGSLNDYRLTVLPEAKILSFRLGVFYAIPLHRLLTVCLSAGPEYHFVEYEYGGSLTTPYYSTSIMQTTDGRTLGLFGGLGVELRMNRRLAFCIEALGRYAKISGFEGKEATYEWSGGQSSTISDQGTLYYLEEEGYPRLDIPSAGTPDGQNVRKAVFNFSGISFRAGLNFKF
jgi:hypothetical protein